MKRIALILCLLWATPALAVEFGYHPGSLPATSEGTMEPAFAQPGQTTTTLKYTASAGDVLDSIYGAFLSEDNTPESVIVALFTITSNEPDDRVFIDTIPTVTTSAGWFGLDVNFAMSAGVTYCLTWGATTTTSIRTYYDAGGTEDSEFKATGLASLDPWGAEGTNDTRKYLIYGVVTSGAATPTLSIGTTQLGTVSLGK